MLEDRRRYRKIFIRLWKNPAFRKLPYPEKAMTLYLLSGPQTNRVGLFHVQFGTASEDLSESAPMLRKRLDRVVAAFDWQFDPIASVLWIPSWWDFNAPTENLKNMQGALCDLSELPSTPLILKFASHLAFIPEGLHALFGFITEKTLKRTPIGQCADTDRTQEQEQEQEKEQEREQKQEDGAVTSPALTIVTDPMVFAFPVVGGTNIWHLRQSQIAKWGEYFPSLDVLGECRHALAWCDANPSKRKTAAGMVRFLTRWLTNTNDKPRSSATKPLVTGSLKTAGNDAALASFVARHQRHP